MSAAEEKPARVVVDEKMLTRFSATEAEISGMRDLYMSLTVEAEGQEAIHAARITARGHRLQVESIRVSLKEDSLRRGQAIDAEANRLKSLIAPIEEHLQREEGKAEAEKARIEAEKEREREEVLRGRVQRLGAVRSSILPFQVAAMDGEEFEVALKCATEADEEQKRKDAEAAKKRRADEDRIEADRNELDKHREADKARRKVEQAALDEQRAKDEATRKAEQERIDEERAEVEKAKAALEEERREQERVDAKRAAEECERAETRERERLALKHAPEMEKVMAFADDIERLELPEVWCSDQLASIVASASDEIRELA